MPSEKLQVILQLVADQYKREARDAATATSQIGTSAQTVTGKLGALIGPAAIGGAIIGLGRMAIKAGENADRLFDLEAQTGLSTDALQEWEFVAKVAGATTEVFSDAVKAVIRNLSDTAGATGAAGKAYETLGINVKDANGNLRDAGTITEEVFDKLAGMENITARNALAQDIFGKKWEETVSILDLGTEALSDLRREGEKGVVSAEALRNSDKLRETWQKLLATVGPKLNEALGKIAPLLTDIAEGAGEAIEGLEPLLDVLGFIVDRYGDVKGALDEAADSEDNFTSFLGEAGGLLIGFGGGLGALAGGIDSVTGALDDDAIAIEDVHESWLDAADAWRTGNSTDVVIGALFELERQLDDTKASTDDLRNAEINLANERIASLSPALDALQAIEDAETAQRDLITAQEDGKTTQSELTQLQLEAAIAAETAKVKIAEFGAVGIQSMADFATATGISFEAASNLYIQLGLLDGFTASVNIVTHYFDEGGKVRDEGLPSDLLNGRAAGGSVRAGRPYLVGERGPEMMVPNQSGTIMPNGWNRPNSTINVYSPTNNLAQDLQLATILATVNTMVEVQG